jgi:hypothetical protein
VEDEKGDLLADSHNNLKGWKNYFSQLLNVRQIEIHRAEPLVPDPGSIAVKIVIEQLKRNKSPGSDQIPAELIKQEV